MGEMTLRENNVALMLAMPWDDVVLRLKNRTDRLARLAKLDAPITMLDSELLLVRETLEAMRRRM